MVALLCGDQSGTVLNPAFVRGAHLLGMALSSDAKHTPAMALLFARRSQTAAEYLAEVLGGNDSRVKVQLAIMVASSWILLRMAQTGTVFIQKSCDFIEAGNLRFVPACGRPPEFSEDLHETLVALSQTIYWANYMFLMYGGPEPRATAKLEREFRQELPVG